MSYRQQRRGGYEADPWIGGSGGGNGGNWGGQGQQMWGQQMGHDGYGHAPQVGAGYAGSHQQNYYAPPQPMRQARPQPAPHQAYSHNRFPQRQQQQVRGRQQQNQFPAVKANNRGGPQGGPQRGIKRLGGQNFNNGGPAKRRPQQNRQNRTVKSNNQTVKKATVKTDGKDECVVLDDSEKKPQEAFCNICQEKFEGTYNQHKLTKPHREKRAQKYPSCGPCGLKFNGEDARSRYEVHLGSKAHMQVVETAELEIKEGQEPEGTELCEDVEASFCTLCEAIFKKDHIDTHCKTKGHLKRITKKKAEAERAAKKAEEEAKKAEAAAKGETVEVKAEDKEGEEAAENGDAADDEDVEGDDNEGDEAEGDEEGDEGEGEGEEDGDIADDAAADDVADEAAGEEAAAEEEAAEEAAAPEEAAATAAKTPRKSTRGRARGKGRK